MQGRRSRRIVPLGDVAVDHRMADLGGDVLEVGRRRTDPLVEDHTAGWGEGIGQEEGYCIVLAGDNHLVEEGIALDYIGGAEEEAAGRKAVGVAEVVEGNLDLHTDPAVGRSLAVGEDLSW